MIIKPLAVFLLVVSVYLSWWAVSTASFLWLLPFLVLLVAAMGLFLSKRWAQYLWHFLVLSISLWWVGSIAQIALLGWPYDNVLSTAISLAPGLLLVTVCAGGSAVVAKHFRDTNNVL